MSKYDKTMLILTGVEVVLFGFLAVLNGVMAVEHSWRWWLAGGYAALTVVVVWFFRRQLRDVKEMAR